MPEFLPFVRQWFETTFSEATPPQRDGWDAIASGRDTLIVAPTGSGKTLASFLWALDHLHRLGLEGRLEDRVYVVYVSPLRSLNNDIEKNLRAARTWRCRSSGYRRSCRTPASHVRSASAARPRCGRSTRRWRSSPAPPRTSPSWWTPASRATSTWPSSRRSTISSRPPATPSGT